MTVLEPLRMSVERLVAGLLEVFWPKILEELVVSGSKVVDRRMNSELFDR